MNFSFVIENNSHVCCANWLVTSQRAEPMTFYLFLFNSYLWADIKECEEDACEQQCMELEGSYNCSCSEGFTKDADGHCKASGGFLIPQRTIFNYVCVYTWCCHCGWMCFISDPSSHGTIYYCQMCHVSLWMMNWPAVLCQVVCCMGFTVFQDTMLQVWTPCA